MLKFVMDMENVLTKIRVIVIMVIVEMNVSLLLILVGENLQIILVYALEMVFVWDKTIVSVSLDIMDRFVIMVKVKSTIALDIIREIVLFVVVMGYV